MPFRCYCFLGCRAGPHGTRCPSLNTCDTFDLAYEWLVNHLVKSSALNHGLSDEDAREALAEHPTYIVEVDEHGWPVDGHLNYPDNADPAEPDEEVGSEDGEGKGGKAKGGKGKNKGGKGKGGNGKGGKNKGGKGSGYQADRNSGDREGRVVPYNDRQRDRRQPPLPAQPPMHLALEQARQDPRAQLSQAIKFVQAWILLCSAGFLLTK